MATLTADFLDLRKHEVQRQSHFAIRIDKISEELTVHVRSANLPTKSFTPISTSYFNETNHQAGTRQFTDLSLSIHDSIGVDVERQFNEWQELIQNTERGTMGYADEYKRNATLIEYNINGEVRNTWTYRGVWPRSVNYGSMDRNNVDKKTIQVDLSVDKAWLNKK